MEPAHKSPSVILAYSLDTVRNGVRAVSIDNQVVSNGLLLQDPITQCLRIAL